MLSVKSPHHHSNHLSLPPAWTKLALLLALLLLQEPEEAYDRITELCKNLFKASWAVSSAYAESATVAELFTAATLAYTPGQPK